MSSEFSTVPLRVWTNGETLNFMRTRSDVRIILYMIPVALIVVLTAALLDWLR